MSDNIDPRRLLRGERQHTRIIDALAGHELRVNANDYCADLLDDAVVSWEIDGAKLIGSQLIWIPARPGNFPLLLNCGSKAINLNVRVGIRASDLIALDKQLDYYFCLIAAKRGRIVAHPIAKKLQESGSPPETSSEAKIYHEAIAKSVNGQAKVYRENFGVFPILAQTEWFSGLYAVFEGALVYVGNSTLVANILEELQNLADLSVGKPIPQERFPALIAKLDLGTSVFGTNTLFPETTSRNSIASAMSGLLDALTAVAGQYGLDIGASLSNGLSALFDINAYNSTIRTRLFGGDGFTSQIESALGGFFPKTGDIFNFSHGGGTRWISPQEKIGQETDGIRATSGWQQRTSDGWVPYTGNPKENGTTGEFQHQNSDGSITIYMSGNRDNSGSSGAGATGSPDAGTPSAGNTGSQGGNTGSLDAGTPPSAGGASAGSDGSTNQGGAGSNSIDDLFNKAANDAWKDFRQVDQGVQNAWKDFQKNKSGGTQTPGPDEGNTVIQVTEEDLKYVILTRGGGLYRRTDPEAGETTNGTGSPIIPGGGFTDPPPPFFYEWKPTMDPSMIQMPFREIAYLSPEDDGSGGSIFGSFPLVGGPKLGTLGVTESFSKTTTTIEGVTVESYSGIDDGGRRGDGVFGAVSVGRF
jgi:hypothetical protein